MKASKTQSRTLSVKVAECLKGCTIALVDDLFHLATSDRLARKDYEEFRLIVRGLSGEWSRSKDAHIFLSDPTNEIQSIILSGEIPSYCFNPHSFFPTPLSEVDEAIELSGLCDWSKCKILEPSAGDGRFIRAALKACPSADVHFYEIDDRNAKSCSGLGGIFEGSNFLDSIPNDLFDYVFMNPPFNGKEYQKHIKHAAKFLKKGGTLVTVMPSSAVNDRNFRDWMYSQMNGRIYEMTEAFEDTKVTTVMAVLVNDVYQCPDGYKSFPLYITEIMLENDSTFCLNEAQATTVESLTSLIEQSVNRIVREGEFIGCSHEDAIEIAKSRLG